MPGGTSGVAAVSATVARARKLSGAFSRESRPLAAPVAKIASQGLVLIAAVTLLSCASASSAASNKVRITALSDVAFGTIANLGADARRSQSLCLYADTATNGYTVTAMGSGSGGAFDLSSGAQSLPFDVAWNSAAGQSSGLQLTPNVPLTGQVSTAAKQTCSSGPATTASLVVILRSAALSSAMAGTYSGTLTLIVGAE
jgi:hypothetical protein